MANPYYDHGGFPATGASGRSADMRAELDAIEAGFDKLPTLSGNAYKIIYVNASGTAQDVFGGSGLLKLSTSGIPSIAVAGTDYLTSGTLGTAIDAATSKATPVDADELALADSAASFALKKLTIANLKTYLSTLYAALAGSISQAFAASQIELGHASDTTLTRVSAGVMAVEGKTVGTLSTAQTWSASQRGTLTTDNDLSFDQSVTNNFSCTPSAGGTLTFTNHTSGQSGFIKLVNGSNYAIAAAATTKITSSDLAKISVTGTYIISYFSDGTNTYCTASGNVA